MAASPQLVYTTKYVTYVQIDVVLRFSVYACPFGAHSLALAGKGFGNGVVQWFGPSTVAGAIECVKLPSFLLYCRHLFQIVGAKLPRCIAHLGCGRRPDISDTCILGITSAHALSSPRALEIGRYSVAVLVGIPLGMDGVNPICCDTIKARPAGHSSSSYYLRQSVLLGPSPY